MKVGGVILKKKSHSERNHRSYLPSSDWLLVGNGGMGFWDYYRGP